MLKKTPEGIIYLTKTLIINYLSKSFDLIGDDSFLKFYDYEQIVIYGNYEELQNSELLSKLEQDKLNKSYKVILASENKFNKNVYNVVNANKYAVEKSLSFANLIYGLENNSRLDKMNVRNSQFNQVLAKEFANRNIILGIQFDTINEKTIGRIRQNLILAIKYNIPVVVSVFDGVSFFGWFEAMNLLRSFL